jgi:hypothetical protein
MAGTGEASAVGEDARGKGDAVWVVPRTEYVPAAPRISFGDLIPPGKQLEVAKEALASFASPERDEVRRDRDAVELARRVLGLEQRGKPAA